MRTDLVNITTKNLINLLHLVAMTSGVPHYVTRQTMDSIKVALIPRIQGSSEEAGIRTTQDLDNNQAPDLVQPAGGMVVIPVHGTLVSHRGQVIIMHPELTSYERIRNQVHAALNDPPISEIMLGINSGGGAAVGCKELTDYVFQSRQTKPITAIVNYSAYPAAYFIASACGKTVVSQTSGVGSIGVITEHLDASRVEEQTGLVFTTTSRRDNENNGTQHEPLSGGAWGILQRMIDGIYEIFTTSVAGCRDLAPQMVVNTQVGIYFSTDFISVGLTDEVSDSQSTINAIAVKYKQLQQTISIELQAAVMDLQTRI